MKKGLIGVLTAALLFCLPSITLAIHETVPADTQVPMPGADAQDLYKYIVKVSPYTSWALWPGKGRFYPGREPHGALLTTFVNETAFYSIKNKTGMAYDSIVVKENYTSDKRLDALTVIYKMKQYNPQAGDWFWAKYAPGGKVVASGKVDACIRCHGEKKANDYIWTGEVKK